MHKMIALVLALVSTTGFAQVLAIPTRYILPQEVVQNSIQLVQVSTNTFAVRWTYTEAGAANLLSFWEAHHGQKVRTVIGTFESPAAEVPLHLASSGDAAYNRWKEGWLKRRTDKFMVTNHEDVAKIMAGLKAGSGASPSVK